MTGGALQVLRTALGCAVEKCETRGKFKSIALMSAYCDLLLFQFIIISFSFFHLSFVFSRCSRLLASSFDTFSGGELFTVRLPATDAIHPQMRTPIARPW